MRALPPTADWRRFARAASRSRSSSLPGSAAGEAASGEAAEAFELRFLEPLLPRRVVAEVGEDAIMVVLVWRLFGDYSFRFFAILCQIS